MKNIYLIGAIVGALIPILFFLGLFHDSTIGLLGFFPAIFANNWSGGFAADIFIASAVFWVFMFTQPGPKPWIFIVLNLCIGLSCALPAYLYAKEAAIEKGALPA